VEIGARRRAFRDETCSRLLVVLEIFDLAQTLGRCFARLVRAAEIFSLLGQNFVAFFYFFDHDRSLHC
jgi:hypothetical protein